jgi:Glycosyl hydrolase family 1
VVCLYSHSALLCLCLATPCYLQATGQTLPGPPSCAASTLQKIAFGVGSSAPQSEGGATQGGRSPSVWDVFAQLPGKIQDGSTPARATDFYNKYKEDIALMKSLGVRNFRYAMEAAVSPHALPECARICVCVEAPVSWLWPGQVPIPAVTTYHTRRMSISWSRLIPRGRRGSPVNEEAVTFYNNVINELKRNGIEPAITLYHWDMPQVCAENGYCHVHLTSLSVHYHCLQHPPGVAAQRLCAAWTWALPFSTGVRCSSV